MNDSIFVYKDYGNIKFDIKSIMDRKNISVNQIVKKTGLHHQVIRRYYDGTIVRYDKDVGCFLEVRYSLLFPALFPPHGLRPNHGYFAGTVHIPYDR